jgi:hypothetical protein
LVSFCLLAKCADGVDPEFGVIADANGNLFGTTTFGGRGGSIFAPPPPFGSGTVYEIAKTAGGYASTPTTLVSFCLLAKCADGAAPRGLIADAAGNLLGTTAWGGANRPPGIDYPVGGGTVFEIAKTASGYASAPTVLHSFCAQPTLDYCPDGFYPVAGLLVDANGNLFGTTDGGGGTAQAPADGTVFEIAKTASGYASTPTTLFSFCGFTNCVESAHPDAELLADANGNLFGTTAGSPVQFGTVFEITNSGFVSEARFASFSAELLIDGEQRATFKLDARFRLGASSNGIKPPSEPVTLQIGPYTATIPAGSFRQLPAGKHSTVYAFSGEEGDVRLALDILSLGPKTFQFAAAGRPVNLTGPNRMPVSLRIGDDAGSTIVKAVRLP